VKTRYLRGKLIDQVFARIDAGDPDDVAYWLLTDRLGSVRDVVDNAGDVVDTIAYDGFGNIVSETDAEYRGRYAWTGREWDVETALQYNRARYYDGAIARWTSEDPIGFEAGDSNLFRYTSNQTTTKTDPSGLDRYITQFRPGNGGNLHVGVAVDQWQFDNGLWERKGYITYDLIPEPDENIACWLLNGACSTIVGWGRIIWQVDKDKTGLHGKPWRLPSTPTQDVAMVKEIEKKGPRTLYSAVVHNCTHWSMETIKLGKDAKSKALPAQIPIEWIIRAGNAMGGDPKIGDIKEYLKGDMVIPRPQKEKIDDLFRDIEKGGPNGGPIGGWNRGTSALHDALKSYFRHPECILP
jgi:RHS repeat-associated protein